MSEEPTFSLYLQKYIDGNLSDQEGIEFLRMLQKLRDNDPKNSDVCDYLWTHFLLSQHFETQKDLGLLSSKSPDPKLADSPLDDGLPTASCPAPFAKTATAQTGMDELARQAAKSFSETAEPSTRKNAAARNNFGSIFPLIISILLILVAFSWAVYYEFKPLFPTPEPVAMRLPDPLARITAMVDPVFPEGAAAFKQGQRVDDEVIQLESGLLELRLNNGVRIVIEGPAQYHIHSPMKTFCERGRLSVEVPDEAKGFEVGTNYMDIRDLGTEFMVHVTEDVSEVHVIKGLIETNRLSNTWTPLSEGRGLKLFQHEAIRQVSADVSRYISQAIMTKKTESFNQRQREAYESVGRRDDADPALVCRFDPKRDKSKIRAGKITGGRYPGTSSVEFHRAGDFVTLESETSAKRLTLCATVYIDNLDRSCNTILATRGFTDIPGFCWNITGTGKVQFQWMESGSRTARIYESPSCITPKLFGTWIDLAVTVDTETGELIHYMNGLPTGTCSVPTDEAILLGQMTLGNWFRSGRNPKGRQIQGRIDGLTVFSRILSSEEIAQRAFQ